MKKISPLEAMFHPQSIAVVGVRRKNPNRPWPGIHVNLLKFGYPGRFYPINPKVSEIDGYKAYPDLESLPETVDLVILAIPSAAVPDALRECIATGNRNVHIFTAGFKETGEAEGIRLQEEIETIAREGDLNVIGPNCMGIYVPSEKLVTWENPPKKSGPVAFISQSGGNAQDFTNYASKLGVHFSKVISYGNALTMDSIDFLEYFAQDSETKIIAMYLEGISDGRKLLETVRRINKVKPVVILKGGLTESGHKAVASHTGSMAGQIPVWEGFFKQSGAIRANSLTEMADIVLALCRLDKIQGNRVGVLATGGGVGVESADTCSRAGLTLPTFVSSTQEKLRESIVAAGNIIKNPVDCGRVFNEMDALSNTLEVISAEPYIDILMISIHLDWIVNIQDSEQVKKLSDQLIFSARNHVNNKPIVACWRTTRQDPGLKKSGKLLEKNLLDAGIAVYRGFPQAATALAKTLEYHNFQTNIAN